MSAGSTAVNVKWTHRAVCATTVSVLLQY